MTENDSEKKPSFKVNDQRLFDHQGNERTAESKAAESRKVQVAPEVEPKKVDFSGPKPAPSEQQFEIAFSSFVVSLATQSLMQLGEIEQPEGVSVPVDREGARQTIEILSMLQAKTRGNLSKEEERLMEEILHNLRLSYLKKAKA